jgi:hypothetical protein
MQRAGTLRYVGPPRPGPLLNRPFGDRCSKPGKPSQANSGPKKQGRSPGGRSPSGGLAPQQDGRPDVSLEWQITVPEYVDRLAVAGSEIKSLPAPAIPSGGVALRPVFFWVGACVLLIYAAAFSINVVIWAACAFTLPVAVWLMGAQRSYPVLLWVVGMYWIQIAADLLGADVTGVALEEGPLGSYQVEAVILSLLALLVMTIGMRVGLGWLKRGRTAHDALLNDAITLNRAAVAYGMAAISAEALTRLSDVLSTIQQPLLGFVLLRYVCLYVLAAKTIEVRRGYHWLVLAVIYEISIGLTGFIATYHAAFIIILIAAIGRMKLRISMQQVLVALTGAALLVWISIIWTAIKPEYRFWVNGGTQQQIVIRAFSERVEWIADRVTSGRIDYEKGALELVHRIGYTDFYAQTLARLDRGVIPEDLNLWASAVLHVLTPRVLFPDKTALNDTAVTRILTGRTFGEGTSVSIGYVAEAHVDFGFPGMLMPIFIVGVMLGFTAKYFMTRPAPLLIREAFATASLFLSFSYAHNVDKELGGFVTGFVALMLLLKFGYPKIATWLAAGDGRRNKRALLEFPKERSLYGLDR